jgi:hypothetical protein
VQHPFKATDESKIPSASGQKSLESRAKPDDSRR